MSPAPFEPAKEIKVIQVYLPDSRDRTDFHEIATQMGTTVSALGRKLFQEFIDQWLEHQNAFNRNGAPPPES